MDKIQDYLEKRQTHMKELLQTGSPLVTCFEACLRNPADPSMSVEDARESAIDKLKEMYENEITAYNTAHPHRFSIIL